MYGLYRVIDLAWTCDDIYITFRYVDNFLGGKGVVFNQGEYVEGYTHFFWLVLLSLFRWFGIDLASISIALGIISYVSIIAVFLLISKKIQSNGSIFFPFAALALSLNYDFSVWATSGLETSFFTLLLCLVYYVCFYSILSLERKLLLSGLLLSLSCMTRPDGLIFFIFANVVLLAWVIIKKLTWKELIKYFIYFNSIAVLVIGPYLVWKLSYYHDIFPNTYYAKNAGETYFNQGFYYIWLFFSSYWSTFVSFAGLLGVIRILSLRKGIKEKIESLTGSTAILSMIIGFAGSVAYLILFVARVGGDFMFARFIVPVLPFLYITIEISLRYFLKDHSKVLAVAFVVLLALIFYEKNFRDDLFQSIENNKVRIKNYDQTRGITDERLFYTSYWDLFPKSSNLSEGMMQTGKILNPYFKDLDITVAIAGARNYLGYYAHFKNIIIDNGLTDKFIASQNSFGRKRIGHEKSAPLDYLIKRKAILGFYDRFRNDVKQKPYSIAYISLKELGIKMIVEVIYYDKKIIEQLTSRLKENFIYTDMELYVRNYVNKIMHSKSVQDARKDYKNLKEFYFNFNDNPLEKEIIEYISD